MKPAEQALCRKQETHEREGSNPFDHTIRPADTAADENPSADQNDNNSIRKSIFCQAKTASGGV